ncbi:MAG: hypothetical protein VB118_01850 [Oscillospiraceae bacterium]|nr:hypothetical protein [Oscillospiraceae bacterium]
MKAAEESAVNKVNKEYADKKVSPEFSQAVETVRYKNVMADAFNVFTSSAVILLDHYISTVFTNGFKAQVVGVSKEAAHRYKLTLDCLL